MTTLRKLISTVCILGMTSVVIELGYLDRPVVTLGPPVIEAPAASISVPDGVLGQYLESGTVRLMFRCGGGDRVQPFLYKLGRGHYELWVHTAPCWGT